MKSRGKVSVEDISPRTSRTTRCAWHLGRSRELPPPPRRWRASAAIRGLHKYAMTEGCRNRCGCAVACPASGAPPPQGPVRRRGGTAAGRGPRRRFSYRLARRRPLELLYATGARVSEAVSLCADDLDLDGDVPVVRLFGKGRKERIVPVGSFAVDALDAYRVRARPALAARGRDPPRFPELPGGALSRQSAWTAIRRAAQAAQLSVSPHTLRHFLATHLLEGGASARGAGASRARVGGDNPDLHPDYAAALREVFTFRTAARGTDAFAR